jgi:hypothetical protein
MPGSPPAAELLPTLDGLVRELLEDGKLSYSRRCNSLVVRGGCFACDAGALGQVLGSGSDDPSRPAQLLS